VVRNTLASAGRRLRRLTLFSLFCISLCCSASFAGEQPRARNFKIGTFDSQGRLDNSSSAKFKLSLSSFVAYFVDEQDLNLGFAIGPAKGKRSYALSLDFAPHHGGIGLTWFLSPKSRFKILQALAGFGAGVGFNYTYNTTTDKFEPGLKGTLIRW
jgi:hypothetical protein